jgi:5-methylthioribose kinase
MTAVVTESKILTAGTVPAYLADHLDQLGGLFSPQDELMATAIQGGNVNYAFCVSSKNTNNSAQVFVKQAPEFVAVFGPDGFPLSSERMAKEMDVYEEWRILLGDDLASKYLPKIYFFDSKYSLVVVVFWHFKRQSQEFQAYFLGRAQSYIAFFLVDTSCLFFWYLFYLFFST